MAFHASAAKANPTMRPKNKAGTNKTSQVSWGGRKLKYTGTGW